MPPNKVRMLLVVIVFLLIYSILMLTFWGFVRETIVMPIHHLIWVGGLITNSIPQEVYLALLAFISFSIALNAIKNAHIREPEVRSGTRVKEGISRYQFWVNLREHSFSSEFSRLKFARETRKLILAILSYQEGLDPVETEQKVVNNEIIVPGIIRNLVQERQLAGTQQPGNWRLIEWIQRFRLFGRKKSAREILMDKQIEEIIHYIEGLLEINHDRNQPHSQN
jgi:hypothetical protein